MDKKLGKRDIILLVVIFAVIMTVWGVYRSYTKPAGNRVRVTLDGEIYGEYSLDEEQEIPIKIDGEERNTLVISDGKADVTWADCPDQICVDTAAISAEGETIVCLPHKVVVEVISSEEENDFDTMVN